MSIFSFYGIKACHQEKKALEHCKKKHGEACCHNQIEALIHCENKECLRSKTHCLRDHDKKTCCKQGNCFHCVKCVKNNPELRIKTYRFRDICMGGCYEDELVDGSFIQHAPCPHEKY